MKRYKVPYNFSIKKARKIQEMISKKIIKVDDFTTPIKYIGGVDIAYSEEYAIGSWVVLRYYNLTLVDKALSKVKIKFPYVPTLLSFREVSPAISAYLKLKIKPDISLVDGQGFLHPYRAGFASHLGIILNIPTIGVAKKLLCGKIGKWKNSWAPVIDRGEIIGAVLRTKGKPICVSIGHRVSLETSIKIVKSCIKSHRLPIPILMAHTYATKEARMLRKH